MNPARKPDGSAEKLQTTTANFVSTSTPTKKEVIIWRNSWMKDRTLRAGARSVLRLIKDCAYNRTDRSTPLNFTVRWLGEETGYKETAIRSHLRELRRKGYISTATKISRYCGQVGNDFTLIFPEEDAQETAPNIVANEIKERLTPPPSDSAPPPSDSAPPPSDSAPPPSDSAGLKEQEKEKRKREEGKRAASRADARKPAAPQGGNFSASPEQARLVALWNANINAMVRSVPCPATELTARDIQSLQVEHACAAVRIFIDRCDQRRGSDLGKDRIQNPIAYLFKPSGRTQQEIYSEKGRYKDQLWTIERLEEYCEHRFGKLAPQSQPAATASVVEGVHNDGIIPDDEPVWKDAAPIGIIEDDPAWRTPPAPTEKTTSAGIIEDEPVWKATEKAITEENPAWKALTPPQRLVQASGDEKQPGPHKEEQNAPKPAQVPRPLPVGSDVISPLARKLNNTSRGAEKITLEDIWGEMKRVSGRGPRAYRLVVDGLAVLSGNITLITSYKRRLDFGRGEEAMCEWVEKKISKVEKSLSAPEPKNITPFEEVLEKASRKPAPEVPQIKGAPKVKTSAPKKKAASRLPASSRADLLERAKGFDGRFDEVLLKEVLLGLSPVKAAEWGLETHKKSFDDKTPINARYWQWAKEQIEGTYAE